MTKQTIGLTLSGGGARGYSHIGVLKALEEHNLKPSIISGTSMGAIIGSLIANGYSSEVIRTMALEKGKSKIFHINGFKLGLSSHKYVKSILSEILPNTFSALKIPLHISTTNLTTSYHESFSSGDLIPAILASISIPFVFKPVKIGNCFYADGGLVKNLPASTIRPHCDVLIGSHVNHIEKDFNLEKTSKLADRCLRISIFNTVKNDAELCDIYIDPKESGTFNVLDFSVVDDIIDVGYNAAVKAIRTYNLST